MPTINDRSLEFSPVIPEDIQAKLLKLAAEGKSIQVIEKTVHLSYQTIARYLMRDPLFEKEWSHARKLGGDVIADQLLDVYDGAETVADAMIARGKSDNIRTLAGWRHPARYGVKLNIETTHTIDLSKALEQADARLAAIQSNALQGLPPVDKAADYNERERLQAIAARQAARDNAIVVEVEAIPDRAEPKAVHVAGSKRISDAETFTDGFGELL